MSQGAAPPPPKPAPGPAPGPPPAQSAGVLLVGIYGIVLGALASLCGLIIFAAANWVSGMLGIAQSSAEFGAAPDEAKEAFSAAGGMVTGMIYILAFLVLVIGVLTILGGYGTCVRKQWGRILSFVMAVLWGIYALFVLWGMTVVFTGGQFVVLLITAGYTVATFVVLLNARNAAEFR